MPNVEELIHQVEDLIFNTEGPFPAVFSMQYVPAANEQRFVWRVMIQSENRTATAAGLSLGEALETAVAEAQSYGGLKTEEGLTGGMRQVPAPMGASDTPPVAPVNPNRE